MPAPAVSIREPLDVRDAAHASPEWSQWYARYLTRIASQSARTLDLSYQVLECVSRGRLTPAVIDDVLREFSAAHSGEYTNRLIDLTERFADGLVQVMTPVPMGEPSGATASPALLHELTRRYADLFATFNDLRAGQIEDCLRALLTAATTMKNDPSRVLALMASVGDTASSSLIVENATTESIVITCAATDVRRADAVGPAFDPALVLAPEHQMVEPGQQARVHALLRLDAAIYEPDVPYVGALRVMRGGRVHLEVPLRIQATRGSR